MNGFPISLGFSLCPQVVHAYPFISHYGIRDTLLLWLNFFLSNRSQYVVLDNQKSHPTEVLSGVPQSTVLASGCSYFSC